ncbi:hypothetical protein EDC01DRAFT_632555 [Geopyxis carbonaria]|nr:hypothetical protein EDC01DRAFT_632555 [Geopyxis carbonaria]
MDSNTSQDYVSIFGGPFSQEKAYITYETNSIAIVKRGADGYLRVRYIAGNPSPDQPAEAEATEPPTDGSDDETPAPWNSYQGNAPIGEHGGDDGYPASTDQLDEDSTTDEAVEPSEIDYGSDPSWPTTSSSASDSTISAAPPGEPRDFSLVTETASSGVLHSPLASTPAHELALVAVLPFEARHYFFLLRERQEKILARRLLWRRFAWAAVMAAVLVVAAMVGVGVWFRMATVGGMDTKARVMVATGVGLAVLSALGTAVAGWHCSARHGRVGTWVWWRIWEWRGAWIGEDRRVAREEEEWHGIVEEGGYGIV